MLAHEWLNVTEGDQAYIVKVKPFHEYTMTDQSTAHVTRHTGVVWAKQGQERHLHFHHI